MQKAIVSYKEISLATAELEGYLDWDGAFGQASVDIVDVKRQGSDPAYVDAIRRPREFKLFVKCKGTFHLNIATLNGLFNPHDRTLRTLIVADSADSNRQWFIQCKCKEHGISQDAPVTEMVYTMWAPTGVWTLVNQTTESTLAVAASPATKDVTPIGNYPVAPIIEITPTSAKSGGFTYKRFIPLYNATTEVFADYPLEVTFGGLDTDALTTTKMQADGDDLRIYIDGVETTRWLQAMDTVATKVWAIITLQPKIELTIAANLVGDTTITFQSTKANKAAIERLPSRGIALLETEVVSWTGKIKGTLTITGVTRGAKGSTAAGHSAGVTLRYLEHEVWMYYGNASLAAPESDDTKKPIFLLTSTNTSWDYDEFATDTGKRAGEFKPSLISYKAKPDVLTSQIYTTTQVGIPSSPATEMGMKIAAFLNGIKSVAENATLEWRLYHPAGITTVTSSGKKNKSGTTWGTGFLASLQYATSNSLKWITKWTEAAPTTSYEALTNTGAQALGATMQHIRFILSGGAAASAEAELELSDVTLALDSARVPQGTLNAEQSANYELDCQIKNDLTGDFVELKFSMELNQTLQLDCLNRKVTYLKDGTRQDNALTLSTNRIDWLNLTAGVVNTIRYTEVGVAAVNVVIKHSDRFT